LDEEYDPTNPYDQTDELVICSASDEEEKGLVYVTYLVKLHG